MGALALSACGSGSSPSAGHAGGGTDPGSSAIKVRYESEGGGGDAGDGPSLMDVVVDGERVRVSERQEIMPDRVVYNVVWDGRNLLIEEPDGGSPQRIEDAPADQRPGPFVMHAGDAAFAATCPQGTPTGHRTVLGRAGTTYACPAHRLDDVDVEKSELTLDDATGLMLERTEDGARTVALEITVGFAIDESTFSTELPAGAATEPAPLSSVESLPTVSGGELRMAEVTQGPSVVVIGDLAGLKHAVADLLPLTHDGTRPRTYGLLNAIPSADWKGTLLNPDDVKRFVAEVSKSAGTLPVPVGIDIKGAVAEPLRSFDLIESNTTVVVAFDARGKVAARITGDELRTSPNALTDWIEANS